MDAFKDVSVTINDKERNFRIKKFDARTGLFMLTKVTGIIAPVLEGIDVKTTKDKGVDGINFTQIATGLSTLSESDFNWIINKCLSVVSENLPAALTPILLANGNFGVADLEYEIGAIITLTIHAITFNLSGVFPGSLSDLLPVGLSTQQPTTPT